MVDRYGQRADYLTDVGHKYSRDIAKPYHFFRLFFFLSLYSRDRARVAKPLDLCGINKLRGLNHFAPTFCACMNTETRGAVKFYESFNKKYVYLRQHL